MFSKINVTALLVVLGSVVSSAQDSLSLAECVDYALDNHLTLKNSLLDEKKADYQIKETRAIGLPQVDGKIDLLHNVEVQKGFAPASALDPAAPDNLVIPLAFGIDYSSNAGVTVSQLLFNNSFFVGLEASKTYKKLSAQNTSKTKEDVVLNVTKAYYGVLVNNHRAELLGTNREQLEKLLSDVKVMYEAGVAESIEITKLTVSLNNLLTEIERIEAFKEVSLNLLKFNMGRPLSDNLVPSETLESILGETDTSSVAPLDAQKRIDYQLLQTQLELSELNIKSSKSNAIPTAAAFANLGANYGALEISEIPKLGEWETYALVGLQVNIPIFSSFKNKSIVQQAVIDKEKIANQMEQATMGFELEYVQLKDNFNNYLNSLSRQRTNLELAQAVFNDAQIKYQAGVGSNYDIVVAQTSLKESQTNYLATVYDLLITQADLDKCTGNLNK